MSSTPKRLISVVFCLLISACGSEPMEIDVDIPDNTSTHASSSSEVEVPLEPAIQLELRSQPTHNNFTRYLTFKNWQGKYKRVAIKFTKESGLVWNGTVTSSGMNKLESLATTGNRSYWDTFYFENRGGSTTLSIKKLTVQMHYTLGDEEDYDVYQNIIDSRMNTVLNSGYHKINLETYARNTRLLSAAEYMYPGKPSSSWTRLFKVLSLPDSVQLAIQDLGKSGSDGKHGYTDKNPQYGKANSLLCSEYVSWYYYEAGVKLYKTYYFPGGGSITPMIPTETFRDITGTTKMRTSFKNVDRLYCFHASRQRFEHTDTGDVYIPQAGDFLERRKDGSSQHAMMMLSWDDTDKIAYVLNGPWPVRVRKVRVGEDEATDYKDYCIGRLPEN